MKIILILSVITSFTLAASVQAQTYLGNGATGFGGPVGNGSVSISDTANSMTITFNVGTGTMDNDLVLYLNTQAGGFSDTSSFHDAADGGRTAISGYNSGNPSQTVETFASGFGADFAISIENSFIGVFGLAAGGNGSLNYLFGQSQSGINTDPSYSITLNAAQMSQIGLTAGSGQSFSFDGTLISLSAYRANETIGASHTIPDTGAAPNGGFNGSQVFTAVDNYTLTTVPEPATASLLVMSASAMLLSLRRRK
jgi:hypothetical protein